jgi:hypothetical protein
MKLGFLPLLRLKPQANQRSLCRILQLPHQTVIILARQQPPLKSTKVSFSYHLHTFYLYSFLS